MKVYGITGSIACGKSTVTAYLIDHGFTVIDADKISREGCCSIQLSYGTLNFVPAKVAVFVELSKFCDISNVSCPATGA